MNYAQFTKNKTGYLFGKGSTYQHNTSKPVDVQTVLNA